MKNTLSQASRAKQSRGLVRVAGQVVPFTSAQVDNNSYYAADTFRVTFPVSSLPAGLGPDWWFSQSSMDVEVFAGFPADPNNPQASELAQLIYGRVDEVGLEFSETQIEVIGRDLSGQLIDTKTFAKYPNQTASQVATILAQKHGLTPVATATSTKVGKFYSTDHVRLQSARSEWDLLCWLAREEGFLAYVKGQELHFEPAPAETQDPYVFQWQATPRAFNGERVRVSRNLNLAKDIKVTVHSWNAKQKNGFTVTAQASHTRNQTAKQLPIPVRNDAQEYHYTIRNLSRADAQKRANQILKELSLHEIRLEIEGPADNLLQRTDVIRLQGTSTAADQNYFIDSLVRTLDAGGGYSWRIEAKNHTPESTPGI